MRGSIKHVRKTERPGIQAFVLDHTLPRAILVASSLPLPDPDSSLTTLTIHWTDSCGFSAHASFGDVRCKLCHAVQPLVPPEVHHTRAG